jgi:branched-subunit amino acid transport protein AzlD
MAEILPFVVLASRHRHCDIIKLMKANKRIELSVFLVLNKCVEQQPSSPPLSANEIFE